MSTFSLPSGIRRTTTFRTERRDAERDLAARRRAQAEQARDNAAAHHPLGLR